MMGHEGGRGRHVDPTQGPKPRFPRRNSNPCSRRVPRIPGSDSAVPRPPAMCHPRTRPAHSPHGCECGAGHASGSPAIGTDADFFPVLSRKGKRAPHSHRANQSPVPSDLRIRVRSPAPAQHGCSRAEAPSPGSEPRRSIDRPSRKPATRFFPGPCQSSLNHDRCSAHGRAVVARTRQNPLVLRVPARETIPPSDSHASDQRNIHAQESLLPQSSWGRFHQELPNH